MGGSHILAAVNNVPTNMGVKISPEDPAFDYSRHVHKSGIAGSCGKSIFNFLRSHHTVLHSGSTTLYSHLRGNAFNVHLSDTSALRCTSHTQPLLETHTIFHTQFHYHLLSFLDTLQ